MFRPIRIHMEEKLTYFCILSSEPWKNSRKRTCDTFLCFFFTFASPPGHWGFKWFKQFAWRQMAKQLNERKAIIKAIINQLTQKPHRKQRNEDKQNCLKGDARSRVTGILSRENAKRTLNPDDRPCGRFKWLDGNFGSAVITTSRMKNIKSWDYSCNRILRGFSRCASRYKSKVNFGDIPGD